MSLLGGLASFAQNAGPTAGAVAQAQAQGSAQRNQQAIQLLMLARQQRQMEIENALKQSQGLEAQAHAGLYQKQSDPAFAGQEAASKAAGEQPYKIQQMQMELNNRLAELKASGANEMQIAAMRIQGEKEISQAGIAAAASRQQNQQGFEQGQQQRQQQFQSGQQQKAIQGHLQGIQQTQSGEIIPNLIHGGTWVAKQALGALTGITPDDNNTSSGNSSSGKTIIHQTEYQALKAAGYPDEQINASYQVAP